jgi:type VI secretion system (T6SS) effector TldE1-like protein
MSAHLTYYLFEGLLVGTAGSRRVHITALSGGGGGSTKATPAPSTNNPYMTGFKTIDTKTQHVHGGPIPPGKYVITTPNRHPHLGRAAQLTPCGPQPMYGRSGFYIHGRGVHGSDGCIVPLDTTEFDHLMTALEHSRGGTLYVEEAMGGDRFA